MSELYHEVRACRSCNSGPLVSILDLGYHAIADFDRETPEWRKAPLDLCICPSCNLTQLHHTVERDALFTRYWYRSGLSETMRAALADVAEAGRAVLGRRLSPEDIVVDIGSNDGTLLRHFQDQVTVGVEPSDVPESFKADFLFRRPFHVGDFTKIFSQRAALVFSIAMFYSVDDPQTFVKGVARILDPQGVWVLQMNDLMGFIHNSAYDIVGFEHVCLWSLNALKPLLERYNLHVVHVDRLSLNGGTARFIIRHHQTRGAKPDVTVDDQLVEEHDLGNEVSWRDRIRMAVQDLHEMVFAAKDSGKIVHIWGASNRGSTIVQAAKLDGLIKVASDRDPAKHGMLVPGTTIRIVSEAESRALRPDYYLILPYSYLDQAREREADFLARGGEFILPVPIVRKVGA